MLRLPAFEVQISFGGRLSSFDQVFIGYPQMASVLLEVKKCAEAESCMELLETIGIPTPCDKGENGPTYIRVLKICGMSVGTITVRPQGTLPVGCPELRLEVNDA
jgi:hypothetical protein